MPKIKLTPEAVTLRAKGWTHKEIAEHFGCARHTVGQYLAGRAAGRPERFVPDVKECSMCGVEVSLTGSRRDTVNVYCSTECYTKALRVAPYIRCVYSTRQARKIVTRLYGTLPEGSIVHHQDGNDRNNETDNLVLFASQKDHFRHHRNCSHDPPLWSGKLLVCKH